MTVQDLRKPCAVSADPCIGVCPDCGRTSSEHKLGSFSNQKAFPGINLRPLAILGLRGSPISVRDVCGYSNRRNTARTSSPLFRQRATVGTGCKRQTSHVQCRMIWGCAGVRRHTGSTAKCMELLYTVLLASACGFKQPPLPTCFFWNLEPPFFSTPHPRLLDTPSLRTHSPERNK